MRSYISFPSKLHQMIHRNNVDFSSIEIRSKVVHRNNVDISPIDVTPNEVCRIYVDFSLIEITSKKHVKMTLKFIDIFYSICRRNIDIKSMSIRRGVSVA